MNFIKNKNTAENIVLISLGVCIFSMLILHFIELRAIVSISLISPFLVFLNQEIRENFIKNLNQNTWYFWFIIPFLLHLSSFFYSSNQSFFFDKLLIKLPLVLVPLYLIAIFPISTQKLYKFLYFIFVFVSIMTFYTVFKMLNNIMNYVEYSGYVNMPTPTNHIMFSLFAGIATLIAWYLWDSKKQIITKYDHKIFLFLGIWLFFFLHILSVRSGLLAFYAGIFGIIVQKMLKAKAYKIGIGIILILISLPIVAYFTVPPFQNKIRNTQEDVSNFLSGKSVNGTSDGNRFLSWMIAFKLTKESPFWGIGAGDVRDEMIQDYAKYHPDIAPNLRLEPHSQFIYILLSNGLIGLIIFITGFVAIIITQKAYLNVLAISFWLVIFIAYLPEATLNSQIGSNLIAIFLPLALIINSSERIKTNC